MFAAGNIPADRRSRQKGAHVMGTTSGIRGRMRLFSHGLVLSARQHAGTDIGDKNYKQGEKVRATPDRRERSRYPILVSSHELCFGSVTTFKKEGQEPCNALLRVVGLAALPVFPYESVMQAAIYHKRSGRFNRI